MDNFATSNNSALQAEQKNLGTGALKITPAHDIKLRNWSATSPLGFIDSMDDNAVLNENGKHYQGKDRFTVRKEIAKELEEKGLLLKSEDYLNKDEDALDTWFSAWLWPMSVFDGITAPDNKDINYYYPTSDLVTGPDIIFFWVARMIMAGLEFKNQVPFKNVYFTGIVRDKQRRKMSKSLGNSPDPIELMDKYGSDGVRVGILLSSAAGNDLMFDEDLMLQGPEFNKTVAAINDQFEKFRISDALHLLYKLVWDDFCSWYLEIVKPNYGEAISQQVYDKTIEFFGNLMKFLHPFMPFLTEEIWQAIAERQTSEALIITQQNKETAFDAGVLKNFEQTKEIVSGVRNYRQSKGISPREEVEVYTNVSQFENEAVIKKLANVSEIHYAQKTDKPSFTFLVGAVECSIPLSENLDLGEEKTKTEEELKYLKGFLISVEKKLSNEKFMAGAPQQVVDNELKKQKDAQDKITLLEEKLKTL
ncbi:hypothetical protein FQR65_LT15290 [Abscondita terminalis]|nr:hypothetical protein FQR65_LT15290 [Abscondita terminalis]